MKKKWYVTTPIYYVTAKPHLGSLYSTLLADVIARWQKLQGKEIFFLTGTDEHGQKVAQAAEQAGKKPKEFVDGFIGAYQDAWHKYGIDYTYFIRTTDKDHVKAVQQWIIELQKKGDIYKGTYTGWYCTPCETFVPEEKGAQPPCPTCGRPTIHVEEETYFFKLSAYQDRLLQFYQEHPEFITPKERINEVISFVKEGLRDLSISRTTVSWGIPFPNDPRHVVYVWADALNNYITAIGYGDPNKKAMFEHWWPADTQVIGKDIVRFHAVYWPAFLMATGLSMPRQLLVHGWIKVDKQKMSKSLGNVVDPIELYDKYGADPVRYYLMRHMAITHDGDFSIEHLERTIESDLANDLGNLLNRMLQLAAKHNLLLIKAPEIWPSTAVSLRDECITMIHDVQDYMDDYLFHMALARIGVFTNSVNAYFHNQAPWKLVKTDQQAFIAVMSAVCHSLRVIAITLWPIMPYKMAELLDTIGSAIDMRNNTIENLELDIWNKNFMIKIAQEPLFKKPEPQEELGQQPSVPTVAEIKKVEGDLIDIADFAKVHLVVGTILSCNEIPNSDKLLLLEVNCGQHGKRQILSGIKKYFKPEDLVGKQGVFVLNLKPRKMAGLESQGMMLLAQDNDDIPQRVTVAELVPDGTILK